MTICDLCDKDKDTILFHYEEPINQDVGWCVDCVNGVKKYGYDFRPIKYNTPDDVTELQKLEIFLDMCKKWPATAIHEANKKLAGKRFLRQQAIEDFIEEYSPDITLGEVLTGVCDEILDKNKEVRENETDQ